MEKVRLTEKELTAIKSVARQVFGEGVSVWIFGSRANLSSKGGDIDIYIELEEKPKGIDGYIKFLSRLKLLMEDQKIDLIVKEKECKEPICLEAKEKGVKRRYEKYYTEAQKHLDRLKFAFQALKDNGLFPLDSVKVERILQDYSLTAILDQIVYRYSKLQDILAKLIRSYLYLKGENVENLTMVDVFNSAEKFGIGINKEKWFELRELRNLLVHEYEDEKEKIAQTLNRIYQELDYLENLLKKLVI